MVESARGIIDSLREEIRRIERRPGVDRLAFARTGHPALDALLPGGGFPRGALTQLSGGEASGKTAVALRALAATMGDSGFAAYVDGRGELYPPAVAAHGVDLARLLIVRPLDGGQVTDGAARRALWAAEALLASGAFEGVVLDVPLERLASGSTDRFAGGETYRASRPPRAGIGAMLRRLQVAAEKGGTAGFWLGAPGGFRIPAAVCLELSQGARGLEARRATHGAEGSQPVLLGEPLLPDFGSQGRAERRIGASHAA